MADMSLGRLLIVDDEVELMAALREMLTDQGYETRGFTDPASALASLRDYDYDVLLSDLMMPGMDGISMLRSALEIDPHLIGIIMTGHATVQTAVDALKVGGFDYVVKPFKLNAVLPVVGRAMKLRRLRLENLELRETVAIYELTNAVAYTLDLNVILDKLADAALQQCSADEASIMLPSRGGSELYIAAVRGGLREHLVGKRVPVDSNLAAWVAGNGETVILEGGVGESRFAPLFPRPDVQRAVAMPMLAAGKLVGVLSVSSMRPRRPFTLGQIKALSLLASTGAEALQNATLYQQIRELNASLEERVAQRTANLEAINKELEAFSYSVSHDLRAPLRTISGFSEAVLEEYADKLDEEGAAYLQHIVSGTQRMGELIEAMLGLSRVTRGEMRAEPVDLTEMAGTLAVELREREMGRSVEFINGPGITAMGDGRLLRLVMENLLGNAWKYTSRRRDARIEFGALGQAGQMTYYVRDNGVGFDMAYADKLFAPFQRMHPAADFEGTGIGLATVQRIIQRHGGRVWAEAKADKGATFYFTIPGGGASSG